MHKLLPKLLAKIFATNFGFVPDWLCFAFTIDVKQNLIVVDFVIRELCENETQLYKLYTSLHCKLNALRPEQNRCHFADNISNAFSLMKIFDF